MKNKKGLLINFEGLDYSFKETNSKKLYEYIKENITNKVLLLSFPNYENESSIFCKKYLSNTYGEAKNVNPYAASMFYATDRYITIEEEKIKEKINDGWIIILDRYIASNLIFQASKYLNDKDKLNEYIEYQSDYEYNKLELPKEDIGIYMNMPIDYSYELMKERALKNGEESDGHENNYIFMKEVETTALEYVIPKLKFTIIDCIENNNIKSESIIFEEILNKVKDLLNLYND